MNKIFHGDSLEVLKTLEDNSVDSIVTDPPYGLGFMGKDWDKPENIAFHPELWRECLRVLKPGGHLLAFSGTRTYHRMAVAIEDAGFEIRDMIEWLYFSGFPKSMDISKQFDKMAGVEREVVGKRTDGRYAYDVNPQFSGLYDGNYDNDKVGLITKPSTELAQKWNGWGTALKPAHEPIVLARKPISEKTVAQNVEKWGVGGVNVDGCRIGEEEMKFQKASSLGNGINMEGRFPANCITLEEDEFYSKYFNITPKELSKKASKKDRNSDVEGNEIDGEEKEAFYFRNNGTGEPAGTALFKPDGTPRKPIVHKNNHPTVKPIDLMTWLIRLVTPENGIVLDPFTGSGSTLVAAKKEGFQYIGVELSEEYIEIIKKRLLVD